MVRRKCDAPKYCTSTVLVLFEKNELFTNVNFPQNVQGLLPPSDGQAGQEGAEIIQTTFFVRAMDACRCTHLNVR